MFYRPGLDAARPRAQPVQGAGRAPPDRLDLDPRRRRPRQPRALQLLQRRSPTPRRWSLYSSTGEKVGVDEAQGHARQHPRHRRVRRQHRPLRPAGRDERHLRPLPAGDDEFARAGLTPAPSRVVAPPRVAEAPAALECRALADHRPAGRGQPPGDRRGGRRAHRRRGDRRGPGRRHPLPPARPPRLPRLRRRRARSSRSTRPEP